MLNTVVDCVLSDTKHAHLPHSRSTLGHGLAKSDCFANVIMGAVKCIRDYVASKFDMQRQIEGGKGGE